MAACSRSGNPKARAARTLGKLRHGNELRYAWERRAHSQ